MLSSWTWFWFKIINTESGKHKFYNTFCINYKLHQANCSSNDCKWFVQRFGKYQLLTFSNSADIYLVCKCWMNLAVVWNFAKQTSLDLHFLKTLQFLIKSASCPVTPIDWYWWRRKSHFADVINKQFNLFTCAGPKCWLLLTAAGKFIRY